MTWITFWDVGIDLCSSKLISASCSVYAYVSVPPQSQSVDVKISRERSCEVPGVFHISSIGKSDCSAFSGGLDGPALYYSASKASFS